MGPQRWLILYENQKKCNVMNIYTLNVYPFDRYLLLHVLRPGILNPFIGVNHIDGSAYIQYSGKAYKDISLSIILIQLF